MLSNKRGLLLLLLLLLLLVSGFSHWLLVCGWKSSSSV